MRRPDLWYLPMMRELQVMKDKGVYRLVPRPQGKNVVRSRWVFATKYDDSGRISSHKARLVAKGFKMVYRNRPNLPQDQVAEQPPPHSHLHQEQA